MPENTDRIHGAGPYERTVQWVTEKLKPYLHKTSEDFVARSVETLAQDNPRYARMIEFEVRRRGDGAGLTQDVAEPLVWTGIKTAVAIAIEVVMKPFRNGEGAKWKWIGHAAALGIVAQQAVELFRLIPRFKAGLQGSLEMAKGRWRSIEETGVDPFNNQAREINKPLRYAAIGKSGGFLQSIPSRSIAPDAVSEQKANSAETHRS